MNLDEQYKILNEVKTILLETRKKEENKFVLEKANDGESWLLYCDWYAIFNIDEIDEEKCLTVCFDLECYPSCAAVIIQDLAEKEINPIICENYFYDSRTNEILFDEEAEEKLRLKNSCASMKSIEGILEKMSADIETIKETTDYIQCMRMIPAKPTIGN